MKRKKLWSSLRCSNYTRPQYAARVLQAATNYAKTKKTTTHLRFFIFSFNKFIFTFILRM